MEIVTGKRGFPHVSSYEMQTFQRGIVSDNDVLLDVGDKLNYTIVDNNTVRILSGAILMQGVYCIIPYGTYDEMYIDSIEPGKVRKDVIYAQYNRDIETGMEEVIMDVKKGTEVNTGETPVQPSFPSPVTPLWEGGSFAYVKLYEVTVTYNAISVAEILDRSRVLLAPLQSVGQGVGDTVNLTTTDKSNVVAAVNEVNGKANTNAGDISSLNSAMGTANDNITALQGRMTTAESDIDTLEGQVDKVASATNYRVYEMAMGALSTGSVELVFDKWAVGGIISNNYPVKVTFQAEDGNSIDVSLLIKNDGTILGSSVEQTSNLLSGITYAVIGNSLAVTFAFSSSRSFKTIVTSPVFMTVGFISNPQTLENTLTINTSFSWGSVDALTNSANVVTRRIGSNITGNGRLIIPAWTGEHDRNEIVIRFVKRASNGYTDVVIPLERGQVLSGSCRVLFNGGVGINRIYETVSSTSHIFDFQISNTESYDVFMSAPIYIGGSYGAQTSLSGTEMTLNVFDYSRADYVNGKVGDLNNLLTTAKSNMVNAVNEVNGKIVDTDYAITEYSVPYVSGSNAIFMIRSNDVAVVGSEEYLLNVEVMDSSGNAVEMLFRTTDDSVLNDDVFIFNEPQTSNYEAIPISKVEDATSFISGNNAVLWVTLEGTPDVTVRLTHHKSKTYTVVASPAMPSGTGRELTLYVGNYAIWSKSYYNGQTGENVVRTNSGVSLFTDGIDGDINILNTGEGDSQFANVRIFTPNGDLQFNNNRVGKTSLSGIGDGTITGSIAFSNEDGEEVSGEVVTVTDAIDANAVDVSVDIEPVQEGSGTPSPTNVRPIHAVTESKNLWDEDYTGISTNVTYKAVNVGNGTFTLSSTIPLSGSGNTANLFFLAGNVSAGASTATNGVSSGVPRTVDSIDGYVTVAYRTQGTTPVDYKTQLEKGNQATPYEQFHEPQIEIKRVGKNKLPMTVEGIKSANTSGTWNGNVWTKNNGTIEILTDSDNDVIGFRANGNFNATTTFIIEKGNLSAFSGMIFNGCPSGGGDSTYRMQIQSDVSPYTNYAINNGNDVTIDNIATTSTSVFIRIFSGNVTNKIFYPMIRLSTETDSTFEPYQGSQYIINTGENVYGGTLDATTGKMVVTHGIAVFDGSSDENWAVNWTGTKVYSCAAGSIPNGKIESPQTIGINGISNKYGWVTYDYGSESIWKIRTDEAEPSSAFAITYIGNVVVKDITCASVSEFTDSLASNPLQVVYELATPITINLTPTQIKMLKGTNTVSSNAQNINLTYLKDNAVGKAVSIVEKEIEPQIEEIHNEINTKLNADSIAPIEDGDTASTSYAVGSYIVRNNNLYKVISAIASGASFTSNNIQRTTVMAEILARL